MPARIRLLAIREIQASAVGERQHSAAKLARRLVPTIHRLGWEGPEIMECQIKGPASTLTTMVRVLELGPNLP